MNPSELSSNNPTESPSLISSFVPSAPDGYHQTDNAPSEKETFATGSPTSWTSLSSYPSLMPSLRGLDSPIPTTINGDSRHYNSAGNLNTDVIVGGTVAGVFLLCVSIILYCVCRKRRSSASYRYSEAATPAESAIISVRGTEKVSDQGTIIIWNQNQAAL